MREKPLRAVARPLVFALVCVSALGAGSCGESAKPKAMNRPPEPVNISAAITPGRVLVSPTDFGAGPIVLVVTNQTPFSLELTLETADQLGSSKPGTKQETGAINPGGTAELQANVEPGSYMVSAHKVKPVSAKVGRPFSLRVGPSRPSAQDKVLQP